MEEAIEPKEETEPIEDDESQDEEKPKEEKNNEKYMNNHTKKEEIDPSIQAQIEGGRRMYPSKP